MPAGFEEFAVPTEQGSVRYEDTQVTIGYSTVGRGEAVDVAVGGTHGAGP